MFIGSVQVDLEILLSHPVLICTLIVYEIQCGIVGYDNLCDIVIILCILSSYHLWKCCVCLSMYCMLTHFQNQNELKS